MFRAVSWLAVVAVTTTTLACTSAPVMVGPNPEDGYKILGSASGSACGFALLGIVPLGVNSRTERAYANALKRGGTGLVDTELQTQWWWIPFFGMTYCTEIRGTEVRW